MTAQQILTDHESSEILQQLDLLVETGRVDAVVVELPVVLVDELEIPEEGWELTARLLLPIPNRLTSRWRPR